MRIAHLSDLHLCSKHKKSNIGKTKKLIQLALDNGAQHFVITGDISDNANENDFIMLKEVLKRFDLFRSDKTTVIIGNHDIFGGPQTVNDVVKFPHKCISTNYTEKVNKFVEHFKELFENTIKLSDDFHFPFAKELKDIVLVGVNSVDQYSRFKNPFASNGNVSKFQRQLVEGLLSNTKFRDKVKIVLAHHHFYHKHDCSKSSESALWNKIENFTMKLKGKKKLIKIFVDNGVKIVLHGHSHDMKEYFRKGIRFVNAGASVDPSLKEGASLYLIDAFPFDISTTLLSLPAREVNSKEIYEPLTSVAV
ncbi:MAG: metallophosphoesterase [bacterium]